MDFFNQLGKKATEAYKVTADKTGKIAKETKLKFRMGELKSKIEDVYEEIGKKVYEKHVKKEEISIEKDLSEECKNIDEMSNEIENLRQECLELKDKKQCPKCFKEIDKNMKFCPECGARQEEEEAKEVELVENTPETNGETVSKDTENVDIEIKSDNEVSTSEPQTNLEKTTEVEINPDAQDITEEELKNIGQ